MADPLFKAGDVVSVCGEIGVFLATIRWQSSEHCNDCGCPVYRCSIEFPDENVEGVLCESVLAIATVH